MYPLAHLTGIGTRQAERVPSQACKNGILYGLPPFKVSRQFFGRQVVQAPYFGQVPAVGVGRINRIAQLTAPVRWTYIVRNMLSDGVTEFTELGPGSVLQGLIRKVDPNTVVESKSTL